jgi:hypothetical protein
MRSADINLAILRFAGRHHGLITTEAGRRSGIDDDSLLQRATTGMLERLDRELFRLAGSPTPGSNEHWPPVGHRARRRCCRIAPPPCCGTSTASPKHPSRSSCRADGGAGDDRT